MYACCCGSFQAQTCEESGDKRFVSVGSLFNVHIAVHGCFSGQFMAVVRAGIQACMHGQVFRQASQGSIQASLEHGYLSVRPHPVGGYRGMDASICCEVPIVISAWPIASKPRTDAR